MKKIKLIFSVILVLCNFSCSNKKDRNTAIVLKNEGKEWRLERIKTEIINNENSRFFLRFQKDFTYSIYRKKFGQTKYIESDVMFDRKWYFDSLGQLHLAEFPNLKLISLQYNHLIFKYEKVKYEFICKNCIK